MTREEEEAAFKPSTKVFNDEDHSKVGQLQNQ